MQQSLLEAYEHDKTLMYLDVPQSHKSSHPCCPPLFRLSDLLAGKVPVIEIASAGAQVRRKAEPDQVGCLAPSGAGIDPAPEIGDVPVEANEGKDVDGCLNGALRDEEERHPGEVDG